MTGIITLLFTHGPKLWDEFRVTSARRSNQKSEKLHEEHKKKHLQTHSFINTIQQQIQCLIVINT